MKYSSAIECGQQRLWSHATIQKNPSETQQWFVMLVDKEQLSHMLLNDTGEPMLSDDLNSFIEVFKTLRIREFTVFL